MIAIGKYVGYSMAHLNENMEIFKFPNLKKFQDILKLKNSQDRTLGNSNIRKLTSFKIRIASISEGQEFGNSPGLTLNPETSKIEKLKFIRNNYSQPHLSPSVFLSCNVDIDPRLL